MKIVFRIQLHPDAAHLQAQARLWDAAAPWLERLGEMSGRTRELVVRRFRTRAPAPPEDAEDADGPAEDPSFAAAFVRSR